MAWYGNLVLNNQYEAAEFLDVASYENVVRWAKEIDARPAVQRGRRVNKMSGPEECGCPSATPPAISAEQRTGCDGLG